jgi:hypothetical protein
MKTKNGCLGSRSLFKYPKPESEDHRTPPWIPAFAGMTNALTEHRSGSRLSPG